jgi:hypothetical protein
VKGRDRPSAAPAGLSWAGRALLASGACVGLASCAVPAREPALVAHRGVLEVFLEPADAQGACSVTVGLRNDSGAQKGEALIALAWIGRDGAVLESSKARMDPTDVGQYDAKNLVLERPCTDVTRVEVASAQWLLGWDRTVATVVPVASVDGARGELRWDAAARLYVGRPATP